MGVLASKNGLGFALTQSIKKFANFTRTFLNSKSLSRSLNDLKSGFLPKRLYYREPFSIFSVLAERDWRFGVVQSDGNSFPPIFLQKAGL